MVTSQLGQSIYLCVDPVDDGTSHIRDTDPSYVDRNVPRGTGACKEGIIPILGITMTHDALIQSGCITVQGGGPCDNKPGLAQF